MSTFQCPPGVELDIGNLTIFDGRTDLEGTEIEKATQGVQPLVQAIFSLGYIETEEGKIVELPRGNFALPREKPVPKERQLTKWEQYAKEKGIQKKKRERLVLDEGTGEYVPRYGKGSKNALERDIILPHKEGMGDKYDPFTEKRREKKERIKENKKKQAANLRRAGKGGGAQIKPMQALDVASVGPSGKKFLPKKGLKDALAVVQRSTASGGKFDEKVKNEPKVKMAGRKKKYEAGIEKKNRGKEKERAQKIAERILMGQK